jgi:hypothetical protein
MVPVRLDPKPCNLHEMIRELGPPSEGIKGE